MVGRGPEAFDVDDSRAKNSGRLDYYYTYSDNKWKKEQGRDATGATECWFEEF